MITFRDLTDRYEFDDDTLVYDDAPLQGHLRDRESGEWFAFDCVAIIRDRLWHWTLVPTPSPGDIDAAFRAARATPDGSWISVVEDRREPDEPICRLAMMRCGHVPLRRSIEAP